MSINNAFRDLRSDAELLTSPRPPADVSYTTTRTDASKVSGSKLLRGATKKSLARTGLQAFLALSGKSSRLAAGGFQRLLSMINLGVSVVEETIPEKLRRPLIDGISSVIPSQRGAPLAETTAAAVVAGLITNVRVAAGIPPKAILYKTLASLRKSPRLFAPGAAPLTSLTTTSGSVTVRPVGGATSALVAQRGLLQDDIMYRLTLVAENTFAPIRDRAVAQGMPPVVVLEGFRAENSGSSGHEVGECLDITLGDGSLAHAASLYALAQWARDYTLYDQLGLCYSHVGGGQVWLHVSFTLETRRRQVYTRFFDDTHKPGLYLVGLYTDAAQLAADRKAAQTQTYLADTLSRLTSSRSSRLTPIGVNTVELTPGVLSLTSGASGASGPPGSPGGPASPGGEYTANNALQSLVVSTVATLMEDPTWFARIAVDGHDEAFVREVVRRCIVAGAPSRGTGAIGLNEKRGSQGPSRDAIAILNPTGAPGFGSWDAAHRVQIMDIIVSTGTPEASPGWTDVTEESWALGGGFIPVDGEAAVAASGNVPSEGEVAALVLSARQAVTTNTAYHRTSAEISVDAAAARAGDGSAAARHAEDATRALAVVVKVARDLSVRYPSVGLVYEESGAQVPGLPESYSAQQLALSRTGPVVVVATMTGDPAFEVVDVRPEDAAVRWRSPQTGRQ